MNLSDYIQAERGRSAALAAALKVPPESVSNWKSGARPIPLDRCVAIEKETQGEVTVEEMRPDVAWHRIDDAGWPAGRGRPLIDVAAAA